MDMLKGAKLSDADKELCRLYIREAAKLNQENDHNGIDDIRNVLVAQTPLMLKMVLHDYLSREEIKILVGDEVNKHAQKFHEKRDEANGINWDRLKYDMLSRLPAPVAVLLFALVTLLLYGDRILKGIGL